MGLYRSVICQMACEHCGKDQRAEVQFETGKDRDQEYANGQRIPEDDGLVPGQSFEAYADRFRPDCDRHWRADHEGKTLDVLARYVDQGRLVIQSKGAPAPHSATELRTWGGKTRQAILDEPESGRHVMGIVFDKATWDGEAVDFPNLDKAAVTGFSQMFRSDVTKAMEAAGWPRGRDSIRVDLRACIGDDMKIFVRDAEGSAIP